jgi:hypothetical protein
VHHRIAERVNSDVGSLVIEHAVDTPEGVCGLRASEVDVLESYWSE